MLASLFPKVQPQRMKSCLSLLCSCSSCHISLGHLGEGGILEYDSAMSWLTSEGSGLGIRMPRHSPSALPLANQTHLPRHSRFAPKSLNDFSELHQPSLGLSSQVPIAVPLGRAQTPRHPRSSEDGIALRAREGQVPNFAMFKKESWRPAAGWTCPDPRPPCTDPGSRAFRVP